MRTRAAALGAALVAALALLAGPAAAHADLLDATPTPNTRVDDAPGQLELSFSEPLEDAYTDVAVVDGNGTDHVEDVAIGEDRRQLTASLGDLPEGVYSVRWQALSSADGHTTSGSYLLGVNASLTDTGADQGEAGGPAPASGDAGGGEATVEEGGPGEMALRGVAFLGASLALGVPLFALVARGVDVPEALRRRWSTVAVGGALLAAAASAGLIGALALRIEGPIGLAARTTPGENLALRALAFLGSAVLLALGARDRGDEHAASLTALGVLAAAAGLLVTSLGSHAAADGVGNGLWIAVDWLHQASAGFWVAGVAALAVAGLSRPSEAAAARLVRRFSPLAVASVAVIVVTGALASVDRLTSPSDLVAGLYGFALSAKILLLVPLVALGAYHRYRLLPQLEAPGDERRDVSRLARSAGVEVGLMVVVLLAAGAMTTASPPVPPEEKAPYASGQAARAAGAPGPYAPDLGASNLTALSEDEAANVTLTLLVPERIDHLGSGEQPVWLLLWDERAGAPVEDAEVTLDAWMTEHGHGTTPETDPSHVHEGMYEGATTFSMPGAWELRVNATLPGGDVLRYAPTVFVEQAADPLVTREPLYGFQQDGYRVDVYLDPQPVRVGVQNLTVQVTPEDGVYPDNADVVLNLDAPSGSSEGTTVELTRWREDAWTLEDAIFTERGDWNVLVAFQGKGTYLQDKRPLEVHAR